MSDLTKRERQQLRELAVRAYRDEMDQLLDYLNDQFSRWKTGEIDRWTLNQLIHEFHDREARQLYKMYDMGNDPLPKILFALGRGVLRVEELPPSLHPMAEQFLAFRATDDQEAQDTAPSEGQA